MEDLDLSDVSWSLPSSEADAEDFQVFPASDILMGLSALRDEGLLCDITLEAEGKTLSAHRAVLAAASPYFKALFTGGFKENGERVIELQGVSFCGLGQVVYCCYTTNLKVDGGNLSDVLATATMLQIDKIVHHCKEFMRSSMSDATCLMFLGLAEKFDISDIKKKANEHILANFVTVHKEKDFMKLSKDALIQYLSSDELNTNGDESEVYNAAKNWLDYDKDRLQFANEIVRNIRFHSMNVNNLSEIAGTDLIDERKECRSLVRDAFAYHAEPLKKPLVHDGRCKPRGKEGFLILENGTGTGWKSSTDNNAYLWAWNTWNPTGAVGRFLRFTLNMIEMNNFLFLFAADNETFLPVTMRYDPSSDEWMSLAPAPMGKKATTGSSVAKLGDEIYLISGMYVTETTSLCLSGEYSNKLYKYKIAVNEWEVLHDVPMASDGSAAVGCQLNGFIYVSGGYSCDTKVAKMYAFDTEANLWLRKPSMKHARHEHCMKLVQNKLYVLGGNPDTGDIEVHDIVTEQWTVIESASINIIRSFAVVVDENIYLIGGRLKDGDKYVSTSAVKVFNTESKELTNHETLLPKPICDHVVGLLTLPKLLWKQQDIGRKKIIIKEDDFQKVA